MTNSFCYDLSCKHLQKLLGSGFELRALKTINTEEMESLILSEGSVLSFSGSTINLSIDLGAQRSIDRLEYLIYPVSTSGLSIRYGRDSSDLVDGILISGSNGVTVIPSASGYTFPRYFTLAHTTTSANAVQLDGLSIINEDSEINYGADGLTTSQTLIGSETGGYSEIVTIPVRNDGIIPADIYVSIDSSYTDIDTMDRFEISPSVTGSFKSYNDSLLVPDSIPWHWGFFNNVMVSDDNKLQITDNAPNYNHSVGSYLSLLGEPSSTQDNFSHTESAVDIYGNSCVIRVNDDHSLTFVDPIKNTRLTSTTPSYSVSNTDEEHYMHPAWDGGDRIFFLNGKDTQEVQQYTISANTFSVFTTTSFYNRQSRAAVVYNGYLYVAGGRSDAGSSSSVGDQFWRIKLSDTSEEQLPDLPVSPDSGAGPKICALDGYIYYFNGKTAPGSKQFWRYSTNLGMWEQLTSNTSTSPVDIQANDTLNQIWLIKEDISNTTIDVFDISSLLWSLDAIALDTTGSVTKVGGFGVNNEFIYYVSTTETKAKVLGEIARPNIGVSLSGTWMSPVFRLNEGDDLHRIVFDVDNEDSVELKFDDSIGTDNFEIRGSDESPAAQNSQQKFDTAIDSDEFDYAVLSEDSNIVASGNALRFSHIAGTNDYNAAYLYFGFFFSTDNIMQYKFWWNPASDKKVGSSVKSKFIIVPYIDTVGGGGASERDSETLERLGNNFVYISMGADSDTGGVYSALNFFNGVSESSYSIDATAGKDYEVVLTINWATGAYSLYFDTVLVGSGTIPGAKINALLPYHSYEFFSIGEQTDFEEQFKYLTINRLGAEVISDNILGTPVHREDPLYGVNGSLEWTPVTVNNPLIPKTKYVQFRVTLRGTGFSNVPILNYVKFPVVLLLEDVPVSGTESVYVRYNFPPANALSTKTVNLKTWMSTDKL